MSKINFKKSTFSTFRTKMNEYFNIMKWLSNYEYFKHEVNIYYSHY